MIKLGLILFAIFCVRLAQFRALSKAIKNKIKNGE